MPPFPSDTIVTIMHAHVCSLALNSSTTNVANVVGFGYNLFQFLESNAGASASDTCKSDPTEVKKG